MPLKQLSLVSIITLGVTAILGVFAGTPVAVGFLFVAAFAIAIFNFARLVKLVTIGKHEPLFDRMIDRVEAVLYYVFREKKLLEDEPAGVMHLFFFYGFVVLSIGHFELVIRAVTRPFVEGGLGFHLLNGMGGFGTGVYHVFLFSQDLAAACIIPVSVLALARRWVGKPVRLLPRSQDAENILWFIVFLYLTFFMLNGAEVTLGDPYGWFRPGSFWSAVLFFGVPDLVASPLFGMVSTDNVHLWLEISFWSHLLIFLAFLNYLPYSKHLHLLAAFPNIYLRRFAPRGQPSTLDFENTETFGVSRAEQFSFKTLLDGFACTECSRCNDVCPAHLTSKPLKPKKVVHDLKVNLYRNEQVLVPWKDAWLKAKKEGAEALPEAPEERPAALIVRDEVEKKQLGHMGKYPNDGQLHVDEVWSCTTCGACAEVCPVLIESVPVSLIDVRRHLVMMEADFPQELTACFKGMEVQGNPWSIGGDKREEWCEGLDVKKMRELGDDETVDYLFWVGCAGATDDRAKKIQVAFVKIMQAAGVSFAILGTEEKCNGDPARRMGNEYLYLQLVEENRAVFDAYKGKFKKMVTACPHCLNAFKNDYPQFDIQLDIIHHTELIQQLIEHKKIRLNGTPEKGALTFHDPCYLGRYNGVYEQPRQILQHIDGVDLREMERHTKKSFCCGAGGGRMWMEEHLGERVNNNRTQQAMDTGAKTICVACPFCMTMLEDGTKAKNVEEEIKVLDVAEIVARHLSSPE
ncbi:MAG: 4Fe-4S dicluster domain-containing protein [Pseudomonadota bacterium]